jgi:hypothetical protein
MHPRHRKTVLALVLSLLGAGCAEKQTVAPVARVDKLTRDDLRYLAVRVEPFTISPKGVREKRDPETYLRKAQETCVRVLTRSGLFDSVTVGPAEEASDPTLLVRAEVAALKMLSSGEKQWGGFLAGQSEMKVLVTLVDGQSGKVFRTARVEQNEQTSGGPWSFGATDRSIPAEVGTRIAEVAAAAAMK